MKRLLTLLLLVTLLLIACANPNPPIDGMGKTNGADDTTAKSNGATDETTTPDEIESTTPEDMETTTPQQPESETDPIPPEDLLTVFPKPPNVMGPLWLHDTVAKYQTPALKDISPLLGKRYYAIPRPFSHDRGNAYLPNLSVLMQDSNSAYRVQHITMTDETHACVIYKILHNGQEKYFYVFLERELDDWRANWNITWESYHLSRSLNSGSFEDFGVGDSMEKLRTIEPAVGWVFDTEMDGKLREGTENVYDYYTDVVLLLEDGVLHVLFKWDQENTGDIYAHDPKLFLAEEIHFYPNGTDAAINGQPLTVLKASKRPPLPTGDDACPTVELETEFPEVPEYCTWTYQLVDMVAHFANKAPEALTPIDYKKIGTELQLPFSASEDTPMQLYQTQAAGFPIENILITSAHDACVIYKVLNQESGESIYLYQFYREDHYGFSSADHMVRANASAEAYLVSRRLCFGDFAELQIGDPLEKAEQIDPQIGWQWNDFDQRDNCFLLEDGVLHIWFENTGTDEAPAWTVGGMDFYRFGTDATINGQKLTVLVSRWRPQLPSEDD